MAATGATDFISDHSYAEGPRRGSTLRPIARAARAARAARGAVGQTATRGKPRKAAGATATPTAYARTKAIEDIEVGDLVWAWDETHRALVKRPVKRLFRHKAKPILSVTIAGDDGAAQVIEATTEHPFWVEGRGWAPAGELRGGDTLKRIDAGSAMRVVSVERTGRMADVFNFEVDAVHNYFVGASGVLVHNASSPTPLSLNVASAARTAIAEGNVSGVALAQAAVPSLGVATSGFVNLQPGPFGRFPGIYSPSYEQIIVADPKQYIGGLRDLYARNGQALGSGIEQSVMRYVTQQPNIVLSTGLPGTHAEVQAVNALYGMVPKLSKVGAGEVEVAVYKLQPGRGQGQPFTACTNCSGIIPSWVDVFPGRWQPR